MKSLGEILEGVSTVAVAGHVHPDGDCIGSCLGVFNYLRENYPGLQVDVCLEKIPECFQFLSLSDEIRPEFTREEPYDLFLALDCGDESRLGKSEKTFRRARRTACVDHHVTNLAFADDNYIDAAASSTCELLCLLMEEPKISKASAECLYTGIAHDTGIFQYSNTSSRTMNIAGKLMDLGIDHTAIINDTYYEKTMKQNRILGYLLLKARRYLDDACVLSYMEREEMNLFGATPQDFEGVVSSLRNTKGAEIGIFFYETEPGTFKVSLRSKSHADVSKIALQYGGGGHAKASGMTVSKTNAKEMIRILIDGVQDQIYGTEER